MIAQLGTNVIREDMRRRYDSVGVVSGLSFYDWVKKMFPKNLAALTERDLSVSALTEKPLLTPRVDKAGDRARESDGKEPLNSVDSCGGQKPFDRKTYMEKYMKKYRQRPVVCPECGHEFLQLKRKKA